MKGDNGIIGILGIMHATVAMVENIKIVTATVQGVAKIARKGNTKTKLVSLLANLIVTLDRTLHLQKVHVLFVRQVNIKT